MTFSRRGAVDLSALKQPSAPPASAPRGAASPGPAGAGASFVVEVTEANLQETLQASLNHLVVLDLWSPRSPQSADFNAVIARVVNALGGQILLATIDVDTNPQIAQSLQVQAVPVLFGIVRGQPVPLLQGTADEAQLAQVFDELISIAVQNGVTGRAQPVAAAGAEAAEDDEPVDDPRFAAADEAFAAGDLATAVAEYEKLRKQYPADDEVGERLAGVKLMHRTQGVDLHEARKAAGDRPDDVEAQLLVADLDVSGGHVDDAFDRLIQLVRRLAGDERDAVRERLLELFTVVGVADPRVATARRTLAAALY